MPPSPSPHWRLSRFDELDVHDLHAILQARQRVFAVEQDCVYLDVDGLDPQALHLAAWNTYEALLLAYARILPPGIKHASPSIGRVLTTAAARGTGLGRVLMQRAVDACVATHPGLGIHIHAQSRLEAFYAGFGFVAVGAPCPEDGILHTEMLRP